MDTSKVNAPTLRLKVRLAEPDDAERITTVINSAFRRAEEFFIDEDRIDETSVVNFLNAGTFLLAEKADRIIGCVYVELRTSIANQGSPVSADRTPADDPKLTSDLGSMTLTSQSEVSNPKFSRAYLGLLAVDPVHQRSGLGAALMDAAEDYCLGLGAKFMDIKVVSLRKELFSFYRRRGYVETGTLPFPDEVVTKVACHLVDMSKPL